MPGTVAGAMARFDPALAGQSEALIPPDLTAVGDKLRDEPLALAISGKQKTQRLPWLRVRMPQFEHSRAETDALLAYFTGHDRIPAGAPAGPHGSEPHGAVADEAQDRGALRKAGHNVDCQPRLGLSYGGMKIENAYRPDMIVDRCLVIEIKSVAVILAIHKQQLTTYMRLAKIRAGLLINFNVPILRHGIRRVLLADA